MPNLNTLSNVIVSALDLLLDALRFVRLSLRSRSALAAENLLLRKHCAAGLIWLHVARDAQGFGPARKPVSMADKLPSGRESCAERNWKTRIFRKRNSLGARL